MKAKFPDNIEQGRITDCAMWSDPGERGGFFKVRCKNGQMLQIIASDGSIDGEQVFPWEHVSVKPIGVNRCCTWQEMCWVKEQFWHDDELVLQFHPPKSDYINIHDSVLHLWKPTDQVITLPPKVCV